MAGRADELTRALSRYASSASRDTAAPRVYSDTNYWEARFQETSGVFDWYATFQELGPVFREFCPPSPALEVLNVGCGNSALSSELHEAGYLRVTNIDIAAAAVEMMKVQFSRIGQQWRVMDATNMDFPADSFDLVIDKGTTDAMMHGAASDAVAAMSREVWRTLKPGGLFLLVSHNKTRQTVLDLGVEAAGGPGAAWHRLELRQCRLSPQAMLINVLRSKLNGRPMSEAMRDPALLKEAADEARAASKQMALLEVFRLFKARKKQVAAAALPAGAAAPGRPDGRPLEGGLCDFGAKAELQEPEGGNDAAGGAHEAQQQDEGKEAPSSDPRRQPFCWVYVLQKRAEAGVQA